MAAVVISAMLIPFTAFAEGGVSSAYYYDADTYEIIGFSELHATEGNFVFETPEGNTLTFKGQYEFLYKDGSSDYVDFGFFHAIYITGLSSLGKYTLKSCPVPNGYEVKKIVFRDLNLKWREDGGFTVTRAQDYWEVFIEIYVRKSTFTTPVKNQTAENTKMSIDREALRISGISESTTFEAFCAMLENDASNIMLKDKNGNEIKAGELVGTGATLSSLDVAGKPAGDVFTVLIQGDIDGNGKVTASDARTALRASARLETLGGVFYDAANVLNDNILTAAAARKILRVSAKLESFS
ncbi:MAG: hypothetical protein LBR98_05235 [Syntrophomonadaceae bacterium]|nr:hypothetical protein [Syntrophomonadaceae bacterium]